MNMHEARHGWSIYMCEAQYEYKFYLQIWLHHRTHCQKKNFGSQGIMDTNDSSHRARPNGRAELLRKLRRKTMCTEGIQGGLCARNL